MEGLDSMKQETQLEAQQNVSEKLQIDQLEGNSQQDGNQKRANFRRLCNKLAARRSRQRKQQAYSSLAAENQQILNENANIRTQLQDALHNLCILQLEHRCMAHVLQEQQLDQVVYSKIIACFQESLESTKEGGVGVQPEELQPVIPILLHMCRLGAHQNAQARQLLQRYVNFYLNRNHVQSKHVELPQDLKTLLKGCNPSTSLSTAANPAPPANPTPPPAASSAVPTLGSAASAPQQAHASHAMQGVEYAGRALERVAVKTECAEAGAQGVLEQYLRNNITQQQKSGVQVQINNGETQRVEKGGGGVTGTGTGSTVGLQIGTAVEPAAANTVELQKKLDNVQEVLGAGLAQQLHGVEALLGKEAGQKRGGADSAAVSLDNVQQIQLAMTKMMGMLTQLQQQVNRQQSGGEVAGGGAPQAADHEPALPLSGNKRPCSGIHQTTTTQYVRAEPVLCTPPTPTPATTNLTHLLQRATPPAPTTPLPHHALNPPIKPQPPLTINASPTLQTPPTLTTALNQLSANTPLSTTTSTQLTSSAVLHAQPAGGAAGAAGAAAPAALEAGGVLLNGSSVGVDVGVDGGDGAGFMSLKSLLGVGLKQEQGGVSEGHMECIKGFLVSLHQQQQLARQAAGGVSGAGGGGLLVGGGQQSQGVNLQSLYALTQQ